MLEKQRTNKNGVRANDPAEGVVPAPCALAACPWCSYTHRKQRLTKYRASFYFEPFQYSPYVFCGRNGSYRYVRDSIAYRYAV